MLMMGMLNLYFLLPLTDLEFTAKPNNYNFSLITDASMQFYPNMRYPTSNISYKIEKCSFQKQKDAENALEILEQKTILSFYLVEENPEISLTCDEKVRLEKKGTYIAGEGGVEEVIKTDNFNVILSGKVLLLRASQCPHPNVAIHEIFHALGFVHSKNPKNIMYNFTDCDQTIGDDLINALEDLYSTPSLADLTLKNISASIENKHLDLNLTIKNNGLKDSQESKLVISIKNKTIKEFDVEPVKIGYSRQISIENILILKFNVQEIDLEIKTDSKELTKENNFAKLEIKN